MQRRRADTMVVMVSVALILVALLFYAIWDRQLRQNVQNQNSRDPLIRTAQALQTQIAKP